MNVLYYYNDDLLTTLYAYFRQTDLSIARGLCDKWENATVFLQEKSLTDKLIIELEKFENKKHNNIFSYLGMKTFKKGYLTHTELFNILYLLNSIKELIYDKSCKIYTLGRLRMELVNYSNLVRKRIKNRKLRTLADHVEHYNQSYYHIFYSIDQIISASK